MMSRAGVLATFLSALFFPWPFTVFLAVGMSALEPLVPFSVGMFADALYYAPHGAAIPFFSIAGALVTGFSFFVRSRLKTGTIER